jgi:hypothetical protein
MKIQMGPILCVVLTALSGCNARSSAQPPAAATTAATPAEDPVPADGKFIGRMWLSSTPGAPRGSFIVFLPDHTLLMGSCVETYRLSEWGVADDKIRWREDIIPVEAEVTMPRPRQLELRLASSDREQSYVLASAPYVCPDIPR